MTRAADDSERERERDCTVVTSGRPPRQRVTQQQEASSRGRTVCGQSTDALFPVYLESRFKSPGCSDEPPPLPSCPAPRLSAPRPSAPALKLLRTVYN
ncbi:hypothetical protein INR49_010371 [Caranx melampygus]|nr:hypothetical protein INR49_010371 [Caranx melampygus]